MRQSPSVVAGTKAVGESGIVGFNTLKSVISRAITNLTPIDLWGELQFFLVIPAIIYIIVLIGKSKMTDYKNLFFTCFIFLWFSWWLLFNADLSRLHLYSVICMSQLFIAKLLYDSWKFS